MEGEPVADRRSADGAEEHGGADVRESTDSILEALLVEDAIVTWDPVTGIPRVERRPKATLDSPPRTP